MAERTVVRFGQCVVLPEGLDDITAAAIANPGMSAWAALKERAKLMAGETVLVNGATSPAGRLAVQIAKYMGAKKVIGTGRNVEALKSLASLGADVSIPLVEDGDALEEAFQVQFAAGIDVVVDYLWGKSAERLIIAGAKAGTEAVPIRLVHVGSASAPDITLPSAALRSSAIVLMGSGIGSVTVGRLIQSIDDLMQAVLRGGLRLPRKQSPSPPSRRRGQSPEISRARYSRWRERLVGGKSRDAAV